MATTKQTSVRVSHEAVAALQRHATWLGVSRDAALRQLLADYVERQQALDPEQRLTHLTTVLKYPPMPLGRGTPDPRAHLRFRIHPEQVHAASTLGFNLPGQSRRGHHDYAARPLTDAVMTAIYEAAPFITPGLETLPQTLTHRVALGLWRLAVAATLTAAETRALWRSVGALPVVLNEEDIAWHHPWRSAVAHHILATLLADPDDAEEWMGMLHAQTGQYQTLLTHLQTGHDDAAWLQADIDALDTHQNSVEGRGGAAVWRAKRALEMTRIERWLTDPAAEPTLELATPGWKLRWPDEWTKACFGHGEVAPPELDGHVVSGAVCLVTEGSRRVYWPLTRDGTPVEVFSACLDARGRLSPARLAEVVLLDHQDLSIPGLPAAQARDLGLITELDRDDLVAAAASSNATMTAAVLVRAAKKLREDELDALRASAADARRFVRLAKGYGLHCWYTNDWWLWHVESVVNGIREGHAAPRIRALTEAFIAVTTYDLEMDMKRAWSAAFWLGRAGAGDV